MRRSLQILALVSVAFHRLAFHDIAFAQTAAEYNALGFERYNAGNWVDAITAFDKAHALAPENGTIQRNLANAYQAEANRLAQANAVADAIEYMLAAIDVDPKNGKALAQLGSYYMRESLISEAIFRLEEAIELNPGDVDAHFLLGEAYYRDNDASSALIQWEWVEQVDPKREGLAERMETAYRQERVEYNFQDLSSRNFRITYNKDVQWANARNVLRMLEDAYREIGRQLGGVYPPGPIQVTLYRAEEFSETTQMGEHIGGLYDGTKIRVPAIKKDGAPLELEELRRRIVHEYVHVVVRHLAKENVPWWLNEGLAETLSHDLESYDVEFLRNAARQNLLFSLADISESQLSALGVEELKLAYRQSHATVTVLKKHFGVRRLAEILAAIGAGLDAETAVKQACHYSYATLERATAAMIGSS